MEANKQREKALSEAAARQQQLTKPAGSLGRLEALAVQLAGIQQASIPRARPAAALIFAADHPVCVHGVSAYPSEVTASMLANFVAGGAAASVLARGCQLPLVVVDVGVDGDPSLGSPVLRHAVAGHERFDLREHDAMTLQTSAAAISAGAEAVACLSPDTRVVILGEIGIGNTTPAAAVAAALLGKSAEDLVGPGTGVDTDGLKRKTEVVRDALQRVEKKGPKEPLDLLQRLGGPDIAALVGALCEARARDLAVLVDGYTVAVAAMLACRVDPTVRSHLVFAHRSAEPGHRLVLEELNATPLLDLEMRLGEASGALVAFPLVEAACRLHAEMATFQEAGVPTALDTGEQD